MTEKTVLITGAGRGIGAATAKLFGANNFRVGINYRSDDGSANAVAKTIEAAGGDCICIKADVSIEQDIVRLFETVDRELGILSVLVNNAGIVYPQSPLAKISADRINTIFATNVTGALLCCREAVKRMSTAYGGKGGAIVNVSSIASRTGSPNEYIDYAASKGAIDSMTRGLSREVADQGIRVNCVRPGFIYTEMHADGGEPGRVDRLKERIPMKRGGTPEEVAQAIYWLSTDSASYSTGSFIDIGGGV